MRLPTIKLFNRSSIQDEPLLDLLGRAASAANASGPIVCLVERGAFRARGEASSAREVSAKKLKARGPYRRSSYATNAGWVTLWPGTKLHRPVADVLAELYETALHEFAHVADFQAGLPFTDYHLAWVNRPHEIRANRAVAKIMARRRVKCESAS
jgi:hypothetical protein